MGTKEWLDSVEAKCGAVVTAYAELFDQIGTVEDIPGVTEDEIEEISAVVSVKLMRMDTKIDEIECPEPEIILVVEEGECSNGGDSKKCYVVFSRGSHWTHWGRHDLV